MSFLCDTRESHYHLETEWLWHSPSRTASYVRSTHDTIDIFSSIVFTLWEKNARG